MMTLASDPLASRTMTKILLHECLATSNAVHSTVVHKYELPRLVVSWASKGSGLWKDRNSVHQLTQM